MRHIAIEGRCFVLTCNQFARKSHYPEIYGSDSDQSEIISRGGSCIIDPFGSILVGPNFEGEALLVAEINQDDIPRAKYDFDDARPILERASARETASRVALGAVARAFLEQSVGITILSHVISIGTVRVPETAELPAYSDMARIDSDPVRCADAETSAKMIAEIDSAHSDGDTLGGVCEILAYNLPPGLGSHVHWDRRLDARLASAMMGIQAIKGVEIGDGFTTATRRGSKAHDEIEHNKAGAIVRRSDRAGGTEGGMSNGEILRVSIAMKPISTVPKALDTIDVATGQAAKAINQRSDVCAVPAAGVVGEAMAALVLAEAVLEKFGGDSVAETKRNFESYMAHLRFK
jgi:chorismate synthase